MIICVTCGKEFEPGPDTTFLFGGECPDCVKTIRPVNQNFQDL